MPDKPEDAVYVNVQVQLSTTDKNTTNENNKTDNNSTGNAITGEEHENRVNNILLVLADKDNKFIACGEQVSLTNLNKAKRHRQYRPENRQSRIGCLLQGRRDTR